MSVGTEGLMDGQTRNSHPHPFSLPLPSYILSKEVKPIHLSSLRSHTIYVIFHLYWLKVIYLDALSCFCMCICWILNKTGNVRITHHWDAFLQPLLQWKCNKYFIF